MNTNTWKAAGLIVALAGVATLAEAQRPQEDGRGKREAMLKRFDANADGQLSEAERAAAREKFAKRRASSEGRTRGGPPNVDQLMHRFDADGNHELSKPELEQLLKTIRQHAGSHRPNVPEKHPHMAKKNRHEMMEKYDTDGDGELSKAERAALRADMQTRRGNN